MSTEPGKSRRLSGLPLKKVALGSAVVLAVAMLVAVAAYVVQGQRKQAAEAEQKQLQAQALEYAQALAKTFNTIDAKLIAVGRSPDVVAAFNAKDQQALVAAAAAHQGAFDSVLQLRLLLPGDYSLSGDVGDGSISFASLEMLRRAEQSDSGVGAEVDLFGSADQHITMVERAQDRAGQLIGLLLLNLKVSMLEPLVKSLDAGGGYLELVQGNGASAIKLAATGNTAVVAGEPVRVSVPNTRWTVRFWSAPVSKGGNSSLMWMMILGAALLLIVAQVIRWLSRRRTAEPMQPAASPAVVYAGAVKAIMEGAHPGMEKLVPNLPRMGQKAAIQPVSAGMVGDDITMIMNKKDLARESVDLPKMSPASARRGDATPAPRARKAAPKSPKAAQAAEKPAEPAAKVQDTAPAPAPETEISPGIFRAYDIRGVVGKTLTAEIVSKIGRAIGSEAVAKAQKTVVIGRDGRKSSPEFAESLAKGLMASGVDVLDIGMVPTPLLYFATHELGIASGVMVTGSHNGPAYNGLKIVLAGETLSEAGLQSLYQRISKGDLVSGAAAYSSRDIVADYVRRIAEDIPVALGSAYKIVVDCGNGVAGIVAPQLLRALGHDVVELYCEVDGAFPNHHPDPSQPENLAALIDKVKAEKADLGLAFDGDGDRIGVIDGDGNIIWPDRQLMLLARDVLSRNAGATILFDVKCSRYLRAIIQSSGGKPLMWRTGHSLIKAKMKETGAPLAGEMSGHIFFKERWYGFDDALYTAARLLEVLMKSKSTPTETFAELPQGVSTPELRLELAEDQHGKFMEALKGKMAFEGAEVIDIDGYRVEFADGWGLIRPSNTSPALVLRFEADTAEALSRIQEQFRSLLLSVNPDLKLPF